MASLTALPLVCALLFVILTIVGATLKHECKVDGCKSADGNTVLGICDATTGDCTCNSGQHNYDCRTTTERPGGATEASVATDCTNCYAKGTHYCTATDGSGDCVCAEGYFSDGTTTDCSLARVRAVCSSQAINQVDFFFDPYSDFGGVAYIESADDSCASDCGGPDCAFTEVSGSFTFADYPYDDTGLNPNCAQALFVAADGSATAGTVESKDHYAWKVRIQYAEKLQTEADQDFMVRCAPGDPGEEPLTDVTFVSAEDLTISSDDVTADIDSGISMKVQQGGSDLSGGQITVGTVIDFVFLLTIGVYKDFTVFSLTVANYPSSATVAAADGGVAVKLLENACVHSDAARTVTKLDKHDDDDDATGGSETEVYITYSMKAFAIQGQATGYTVTDTNSVPLGTVYVWAVICPGTCSRPNNDLCTAVAGAVTGTNIEDIIEVTGPDTDARRRRRSTTDDGEASNINLNISFVVLDPRHQTGSHYPNTMSDPSDCYQSAAFLLPLILMGVVLLLSVITIFFLFTKVTRSNRGLEEGHTNMSYK